MNYISINELLKGKVPLSVSIDREARAIYFKVSDEEVRRTVRANPTLSVDYGKNDEVIGVELIRVNKVEVMLKKAYKDISSAIPRRTLATA